MMQMKALKRMTYRTRRLQAGDEFDARPKDAKLLATIRHADYAREPGKIAPPPETLTRALQANSEPGDDDLTKARAEYQETVGKRPYHGWDIETLRAKMAEHGVS